MNYYPHHIGDFNNATRHLTRIERSVYRDMLELYYDTEKPLTLDLKELCRKVLARTEEEVTAVEQLLNEFFDKTEQGWQQKRCDEVIEEYRRTVKAKSEAGKASAAKKAQKAQQPSNSSSTAVEQPLNEAASSVQLTNNQNQNQLKEANPDSGESAPDPKTLIFTQGVEILKRHGSSESAARSFLGRFAGRDETKLAGVIGQLMAQPKIEPKAYIAAAMTPKKREVVL